MPNYVNCDVGTFYETFVEMLESFMDGTEQELQKDIYGAAEMACDELKSATGYWSQMADTPERERLTYEKGWRVYKHKMRDGHVEAVVANYTAPGLTHLIEFGHELFVYGRDTGRRTQARPHIRDAYEHAASKFFGGA